MIQLTKEQLIDILHEATGNVRDFVMDNEGWVDEAIERVVKKSSDIHNVSGLLPSENQIKEYIASQPYYGACTEENNEGIEQGINWVMDRIKALEQ